MRNISFSGPEGTETAAAVETTTKTTARTPTKISGEEGRGGRVGWGWGQDGYPGGCGWFCRLSGAAFNIGNRTENGAYSVLLLFPPPLLPVVLSRPARKENGKRNSRN